MVNVKNNNEILQKINNTHSVTWITETNAIFEATY